MSDPHSSDPTAEASLAGPPRDRVAVASPEVRAEGVGAGLPTLADWETDAAPANLPRDPDARGAGFGGVEVLAGETADIAHAEAAGEPANLDLPPEAGLRVDAETLPWEQGETDRWGEVRWRTLLCADRTPSSGLVMGIAEFGPGEALRPHRHGPAEVYYGLSGSGTVTVEGVAHGIAPGVAVYIPADAEHGTVAGPEGLRFLYSFPTARFAEVDYRFSAG